MMLNKFWNTLFDEGERICTAIEVYDSFIQTYRKEDWNTYEQFFCINPVKLFRKDDSIAVYRNILIEFDKLPLKEQIEFSHTIPFTSLTFSGGKSYHYIISLKEPCKDIKEYKALVKRIYDKLLDCDKSTSNPSRLSRTPGAMRGDIEQKLLVVNHRISRFDLDLWLGPEKLKTEQPVIAPMGPGKRRLLPTRTLAFIEYGANEGGRNRALFINACELFRANYDKEEIIEIAVKVLDLPITEIRQCVESARKAVANES